MGKEEYIKDFYICGYGNSTDMEIKYHDIINNYLEKREIEEKIKIRNENIDYILGKTK